MDSFHHSILSPQRDILGARQTTAEHLALGAANGHVVSTLGNTLNGPQCLRHTFGLVGKLQEQLLTESGPFQRRADGALLASHLSV